MRASPPGRWALRPDLKYLLPTLLSLAAVTLFPTVYLFWVSFHRFNLLNPLGGRPFIGLDNYVKMLSSPEFLNSLRVTALFTGSSVALSMLVGLCLALLLNREFRGHRVYRVIFTLPLALPSVIIGYVWKLMMNNELGVVSAYFLPLLGFEGAKAALGHPDFALATVILADVWWGMPLTFLIMVAGLQAVPQELVESARIDGASAWAIFRHITLPILKPALVIALVIRLIYSLNNFDIIFITTVGGPGRATETFTVLGWRTGFNFFDLGKAAALGVMMTFIAVGIALAVIRFLMEPAERRGAPAERPAGA